MRSRIQDIPRALGFERQSVSHTERLVSGLGGVLGIAALFTASRVFLPPAEATMLVASMGASAVLLFAVPHGALSQPWPLAGGHLVSAVIGVACARIVPGGTAVAASCAVGLAIVAMHYLRCIHPPGGATALVAVVGGPEVSGLGFDFVCVPVMLDATILLVCAVLFNGLFRWRRYPTYRTPHHDKHLGVKDRVPAIRGGPAASPGPAESPNVSGYPPIAHEEFVYALSQIDTFIDVSEEDLLRIYELATRRTARCSG